MDSPARALLPVLASALVALGCSEEAAAPGGEPLPTPQESEIFFQAVDAGTGAAIADDALTVRYLVRTPITLDATATEEVSASEPYHIRHAVARDSLVVEVRLEAPSYHRTDTVLSVARGGTTGPVTIRLARKLGRVAASPPRPAQGGSGSRPATADPRPARTETEASPDARPADGVDRTALRAGDRAFRRGDWAAARTAYQRMPTPSDRSGPYAEEYAQALVRRGISHVNLGEWGGAMEVLEEAVTFDSVGYAAYLHLGRAQCAVGLTELGRQSLDEIGRLSDLPREQRAEALALAQYEKGVCAHREFQRAEAVIDRLRTGNPAVKELEAFLERAEALSGSSAQVREAVPDARTRLEAIRERLRGLGRGG